MLGHRVLKLSRLASISKLQVPFLTSLNIPHKFFVFFFTCAHPNWQNSQSDDGGRSTEEYLKWKSLQTRPIMMYKIINNMVAINCENHFTKPTKKSRHVQNHSYAIPSATRLQEMVILRQHRQRLEQLTTGYCSCQVT